MKAFTGMQRKSFTPLELAEAHQLVLALAALQEQLVLAPMSVVRQKGQDVQISHLELTETQLRSYLHALDEVVAMVHSTYRGELFRQTPGQA